MKRFTVGLSSVPQSTPKSAIVAARSAGVPTGSREVDPLCELLRILGGDPASHVLSQTSIWEAGRSGQLYINYLKDLFVCGVAERTSTSGPG
jgi:hypothetical protein